jgi:antitoxin CptB
MQLNVEQSKINARLLWQCRRGMLELDLMLIPFAHEQYPNLPENEKDVFRTLLHFPDPEIFAWLMGHESPAEPELIQIVQRIRDQYSLTSL